MLICFITTSSLLKIKLTASSGQIDVTADNNLEVITVNGKAISLSGAVNDWTATKTIPTDIYSGDVVSITASNAGTTSAGNPAGILATITYIDSNGKTAKLSTGFQWKCDGKAPVKQGANNGNTIWKSVKGAPMPNIDGTAQWIWNPSLPIRSRCFVKLPGTKPGKIDVTVDNNLEEVTVNGKAITLSGAVNDWTATKSFVTPIKPGDVVAITGSNEETTSAGSPAGILATIAYVDSEGQTQTLSTGLKWTCDGEVPVQQGANNEATVWKSIKGAAITDIEGTAQWIWNPSQPTKSTCSVTIPKPKKATIFVTVDNNLDAITINGKAVTLAGAIKNWTATKTFLVHLAIGDVVAITGSNEGTTFAGNPAGILATIHYIGSNGKPLVLNTGSSWTCDGQAPLLQGANNGNTIWKSVKGSALPNIWGNAQWIWNPSQPQKSTCSVTIPGPQPGKINVTADNNLEGVKVNGKALILSGAVTDWTQAKTNDTLLESGDTISITASNDETTSAVNPAGILATITYVDSNGNTSTLNTGNKWICGGRAAVQRGTNNGNTIRKNINGGPVSDIDGNAQWIWEKNKPKTSCFVTLP